MTRLSIEHAANCAIKAGSVLGRYDIGDIKPKLRETFDISDILMPGEEAVVDPIRAAILPNKFDGSQAQVFKGRSSVTFRSKFGFIAPGVGTRKDEALLTFRGSTRAIQDYVLIDGAAAFGTSSKGYAVHGGFASLFKSCSRGIDEILDGLPPNIRTLHITGHSMGGALATLAAEHLINTRFHTHLYTFGSPRVGGLPFVRNLENHLQDRIHRYYYWGDMITWMPMFPYVHTKGKRLVNSRLLGGHTDYFEANKLKLAVPEPAVNGRTGAVMQANKLITAAGASGGSGLGSRAISLLLKALNWILKAFGAAIGLAVFPAVTIIDQAAAALTHILTFGYGNARPLVLKWIIGAFKAICKPITTITETGSALKVMLSYLLETMLSGVKSLCARDLAATDLSGQQVVRFL